jgi:hypothetical protein
MTGLELGDSSLNFSPNKSPESPTDDEMSKYSFIARLMHYMDGNKISEANRAADKVLFRSRQVLLFEAWIR